MLINDAALIPTFLSFVLYLFFKFNLKQRPAVSDTAVLTVSFDFIEDLVIKFISTREKATIQNDLYNFIMISCSAWMLGFFLLFLLFLLNIEPSISVYNVISYIITLSIFLHISLYVLGFQLLIINDLINFMKKKQPYVFLGFYLYLNLLIFWNKTELAATDLEFLNHIRFIFYQLNVGVAVAILMLIGTFVGILILCSLPFLLVIVLSKASILISKFFSKYIDKTTLKKYGEVYIFFYQIIGSIMLIIIFFIYRFI